MAKVIKYSLTLTIIIILIVGVIYYAYFKKELQVVFNSNGGSVVSPITVGVSGLIKEPNIPEKEGYIFNGWYLNNEKFNFETVINENIVLTAEWVKEEEKSYTIKFDTLGGTLIDDIIVLEGQVLKEPIDPLKKGYEFVSWQYHNKEFDFTSSINNNMVLVAKYKKIA